MYSFAEDVDCISIFVESLHDPHRAAVDRRAEETSHCRVARVLHRGGERRKLRLVVTSETRIEIFESDALLQAAPAQTERAVPQPVHQIDVADLEEA